MSIMRASHLDWLLMNLNSKFKDYSLMRMSNSSNPTLVPLSFIFEASPSGSINIWGPSLPTRELNSYNKWANTCNLMLPLGMN